MVPLPFQIIRDSFDWSFFIRARVEDIIHTTRPVEVAVHAVERAHHATASAR